MTRPSKKPRLSDTGSQVLAGGGSEVSGGKYAVNDGAQWACETKEGVFNVELLEGRRGYGSDEIQYFIRVLGKDRRVDRWVPESSIVGAASSQAVNATSNATPNTRSTRPSRGGASPTPSNSTAASQPTTVPATPTNRQAGTKRTRSASRWSSLDDPLEVFRIHDGGQVDEQAAEHSNHLRDVKYIEKCVVGDEIIDAWYPSPFPRTMLRAEVEANGGILFVDDLTLKYTGSAARMLEHKQAKTASMLGLRGPPGICLYEYGRWSLWEIDGGEGCEYNNDLVVTSTSKEIAEHRTVETAHRELYCQNMGLLSKLFLDHKQEYFTTSNFVYYVVAERHERENEAVTGRPYDLKTLRPAIGGVDHLFRGYFSREKGQVDFNLSCIMVLPPWQRYGIGRMLIHYSYLLAGREPRKRGVGAGTPERPLSDLGKHVYLQYWKSRIAAFVKAWKKESIPGTIHDAIAHTCLERKDVLKALHALDLLSNSVSSSGSPTYEIDWESDMAAVDRFLAHEAEKRYPVIEQSELCHVGQHFGAGDDDESYEV